MPKKYKFDNSAEPKLALYWCKKCRDITDQERIGKISWNSKLVYKCKACGHITNTDLKKIYESCGMYNRQEKLDS